MTFAPGTASITTDGPRSLLKFGNLVIFGGESMGPGVTYAYQNDVWAVEVFADKDL